LSTASLGHGGKHIVLGGLWCLCRSETLDDAKLAALVNELQERKLIAINKGNIKYTLPG